MKGLLHKLLFVIVGFFFVNCMFSQERKLKAAQNQYDKYEYINAQETYLKVVKKGYKSADLYKNLGNSYYFNSQFEEASKWYEELVNSYPTEVEPEYYFRYAQTLKSVGRYDDADVYMKKFVEASSDDQRAQLFQDEPNYLKRIDFQSGRFEIENSSINSSFTDFGSAFFGRFVVFSSSRDTLLFKKSVHQWNEEPFLDLFRAEYNPTNGELSEIEKFDSKINSKFHESTPIFAKDGQTVYFTRNNYDGRKYGNDKKGTNRLKIYRSYKNTQGSWTTPQNLPFNSDQYSTAHPALSVDEKTLYFSSDMPGGEGQSDIYEVAINSDGSFGEPKNLGNRINTEGKETFPFVSANNDLYFASDGHIGLGGLDIYVTRLNPQTDEEKLVVNIGKPVNGPDDDFAFIVDDNSKRGYFSSNRDGGRGKDDIYSFLQLEDLKSFCEITIAGVVKDKDTEELLPGTKVSIYDSSNNLLESFIVGDDAAYSHLVKCSSKYFVRAEKEEYLTLEKLVNTPGETETVDVPLLLEKKVKSADVGDDLAKVLSLNPIYFDFDQHYIRPDAAVELAKVIEVMNQYPEMKIDVRSHTDSHGDDAYNLWLSEQRAKSTLEYMVAKGISADRLTSKGYGETQPVNDCGNDSNCRKSEYQLNRRSEFIIVK
ncbi:flagellar motor protein MotB [Aquimarina sp. BL5]|uniref:OmpA family protein n=1 Tax=Aquimarina sp. BL5 TaxID=1714860 RepID=UPI000E50D003|nr:OmpA family protein [Aquimarina sp. BL5]AXT50843.1 flagellar motor protein MotB [Aquimarina sp. BL5]RKN00137.1 flagellar motor protein MotB [Aquimarina sp. BL5]